jgi:hypothetical protein
MDDATAALGLAGRAERLVSAASRLRAEAHNLLGRMRAGSADAREELATLRGPIASGLSGRD